MRWESLKAEPSKSYKKVKSGVFASDFFWRFQQINKVINTKIVDNMLIFTGTENYHYFINFFTFVIWKMSRPPKISIMVQVM